MSMRWLAALAVAGFLMAMLAGVPASTLASAAGLSYLGAEGTIWRGRLSGAALRGVTLGEATLRARPIALLTGAFDADLTLRGGAVAGEGRMRAGLAGASLRETRILADFTKMARFGLLGTPLEGAARIELEALRFDRSGCRSAKGSVQTDALRATAARLGAAGFDLAGPVSCEDGALLIRLAGGEAALAGALDLRLLPGYAYRLEARATGVAPELAGMLSVAGFEPAGDGLAFHSAGRLMETTR